MKTMTPNQELLLSLLARALFDRKTALPEDTDWSGLFQEAKQQAVLPLVFESVKEQLPAAVRASLEGPVETCLLNNLVVDFEHV